MTAPTTRATPKCPFISTPPPDKTGPAVALGNSARSHMTGAHSLQLPEGTPRASRLESPQLHQEVATNRPGFPAPTIPRLDGRT
jgi:hypothetical protein